MDQSVNLEVTWVFNNIMCLTICTLNSIGVLVNCEMGTSGTVHTTESSQEHIPIPLNGLEQYTQSSTGDKGRERD